MRCEGLDPRGSSGRGPRRRCPRSSRIASLRQPRRYGWASRLVAAPLLGFRSSGTGLFRAFYRPGAIDGRLKDAGARKRLVNENSVSFALAKAAPSTYLNMALI